MISIAAKRYREHTEMMRHLQRYIKAYVDKNSVSMDDEIESENFIIENMTNIKKVKEDQRVSAVYKDRTYIITLSYDGEDDQPYYLKNPYIIHGVYR